MNSTGRKLKDSLHRPDGADHETGVSDVLLFALPQGIGKFIWKELHSKKDSEDSVPMAIFTLENQQIAPIFGHLPNNGEMPTSVNPSVQQAMKLLHAILASSKTLSPIQAPGFVMDPSTYQVLLPGRSAVLSLHEFRLLYFLASRPNCFFTREELYSALWRESRAAKVRVVDAYVRRIRLKIEADPKHPWHLKTIRGMGYSFRSEQTF